MPTSRATWRSDSADNDVSSESFRAASRIARRVRSPRWLDVTGLTVRRLCTRVHPLTRRDAATCWGSQRAPVDLHHRSIETEVDSCSHSIEGFPMTLTHRILASRTL